MSGIQTGSTHLIIPKRIFAVVTLAALGGLSGVLVSNHLYNRQVEQFLHEKTRAAHKANWYLMQEKDDYRALFNKLTVQMDEDAKDGKITEEESRRVPSARAAIHGRVADPCRIGSRRRSFNCWEKEGAAGVPGGAAREHGGHLETEMAAYINKMASQLLKRGKALPAGLADQPYFGGAKKAEEEGGGLDPGHIRDRLV